MKKLTIIFTALMTISAQASFFQETCSSADGMLKLASGHVSNKVVITEREYNNGKLSENEIELLRHEIEVDTKNETLLKNTNSKNCSVGGGGVVNWQSISAKEIVITNSDGTLFSRETVGVSQDLKSVSAFVICDNSGNSMNLCE